MFLFAIFLTTSVAAYQLVPGSPAFNVPVENQPKPVESVAASRSWTDEPLCILQARGTCPPGFNFQELRLSTQPDVNPKDRNIAGQELMHLGDAGDSSLYYDQYDRLYTLTLAVCCKV